MGTVSLQQKVARSDRIETGSNYKAQEFNRRWTGRWTQMGKRRHTHRSQRGEGATERTGVTAEYLKYTENGVGNTSPFFRDESRVCRP